MTVVRAGVGDRQVGDAVAREVARHDRVGRAAGRQADRDAGWNVPSPLPSEDRDAIRAGKSDGRVEVVVAVEIADRDRGRARREGSTSAPVAEGASKVPSPVPRCTPSGATMSRMPLLVKSPTAIGA